MPWPTSTCSDQRGHDLALATVTAFAITLSLAAWGSRWWSGDDPVILRHAMDHPWPAFFFDPLVWRDLTFANLTPLLTASFRLDWLLFGLSPLAFHLHQLTLLWLALVLLHRVLRRWLTPIGACTALLWIGFGKPLVECANFLMLRHYVEGLALSLAAILLFIRVIDGDGGGWKSAIRNASLLTCCVAAATAKEIFVPLPLLLTVLPVGTLGSRFKALVPTYVWLGIYPLWRRWMLGAWMGGYGVEIQPAQLVEMPVKLIAAMGIPGWVLVPSMVGLAAMLLWRQRYSMLAFAAAATTLAVLPIVPVSGFLVARYGLVPAVLAAVLLGWWCEQIASAEVWCPFHPRTGLDPEQRRDRSLPFGKSAALSALIVAAIQLGFTDQLQWRRALLDNLRQQRAEGEFLLHDGASEDCILAPATQPWFYDGLDVLRVNVLGLGNGPRAVYDPVVLLDQPAARTLRYDARLRRLQPAAAEDDPVAELKRRVRPDQPLKVTIRYRFPRLEWEFGPYPSGPYAFLMGGRSLGVYPVPRSGRQGGFFRRNTELMVKYSAPEGWVVYSPLLKIMITDQQGELEWSNADLNHNGDHRRQAPVGPDAAHSAAAPPAP